MSICPVYLTLVIWVTLKGAPIVMIKGEPLMMTLTGSLDHNNIIEVAPDDHNNNEWLYPIMEMTAPDRTTTRIIATPYTITERDT